MKLFKKANKKEAAIAKLDKLMKKTNYETRTVIIDNINNLLEIRYYYEVDSTTLAITEYLMDQETFKIVAKNRYTLRSF